MSKEPRLLAMCHSDQCDDGNPRLMRIDYVDIVSGRPSIAAKCYSCDESHRYFVDAQSRQTEEAPLTTLASGIIDAIENNGDPLSLLQRQINERDVRIEELQTLLIRAKADIQLLTGTSPMRQIDTISMNTEQLMVDIDVATAGI